MHGKDEFLALLAMFTMFLLLFIFLLLVPESKLVHTCLLQYLYTCTNTKTTYMLSACTFMGLSHYAFFFTDQKYKGQRSKSFSETFLAQLRWMMSQRSCRVEIDPQRLTRFWQDRSESLSGAEGRLGLQEAWDNTFSFRHGNRWRTPTLLPLPVP